MGMHQMGGNEALNCLPQDFVSDTEEKGGPRKGCHEFPRGAVSQGEGDNLKEKLVGAKKEQTRKLSASWRSSDPGGVG